MLRLKEKYLQEIVPQLQSEGEYKNIHQVPKLEKIVLNMGVGEAITNSKAIESAVTDLANISGQKPVVRKAKKSIANFKLREGMPIGVSVTLRRDQMYEFLERLIYIALPRVRDFRGISRKAFDGRGNYSLGIKEQIIFPEIDLEKTTIRGLSVNFVTTAQTNDEGMKLLSLFGVPFRKNNYPSENIMVTDQIADMLTRIRNGSSAKHARISVPASKSKQRVLTILEQEGYIAGFHETEDSNGKPCFLVSIKYDTDGSPVLREITRISKPGKRIYVKKEEIPRNRGGLGTVIVSTPEGVMSDRDARAKGIGGELICSVF